MTTNSNAGSSPVDRKVMHHELHSDEAMERAAITLRQMTQERGGRGVSAVMMFEEQVRDLTRQRDGMRAALERLIACYSVSHSPQVRADAWEQARSALMHNAKITGAGTASGGLPGYAGDNNGERK